MGARIMSQIPRSPASSNTLPVAGYCGAWAMLTLFIFITFECLLLAFALKEKWFILLAPAVVCGAKAWEAWKRLQRSN